MSLRSTKYSENPMIPHKDDRPRCEEPGCANLKQIHGRKKDGSPYYRKLCSHHHDKKVAAKHGLLSMGAVVAKNAGFDSVKAYKLALAVAAGFPDVTSYYNSTHRYLKYRKDYCENTDGRLGYICTATIPRVAVLDVDHIDGNSDNNQPENLQTLCKNCHAIKTQDAKDYLTLGRKRRKEQREKDKLAKQVDTTQPVSNE